MITIKKKDFELVKKLAGTFSIDVEILENVSGFPLFNREDNCRVHFKESNGNAVTLAVMFHIGKSVGYDIGMDQGIEMMKTADKVLGSVLDRVPK